MAFVKFRGESVPLEMHKVRIVQKLNLLPVDERLGCVTAAGNNTFLLQNADVFLDMLTDSGVNAMSDRQQAAMMVADDSYAGSATYTRFDEKVREIFGTKYLLPVHQGRAAENILAQVFVKPGQIVPMNYHFTTTKAHITLNGGTVEEIYKDVALETSSEELFKGDLDTAKLEALIAKHGADKIAFVRLEAGTNLIGGQPISLANMHAVRKVCDKHGLLVVFDASLLADNLWFIKTREAAYKNASIRDITLEISGLMDITYFSARKLGCARGGGIAMRSEDLYKQMRALVPLYEGFLTYGGMSVRELAARGVPVITPPGGLGCHVNALKFLDHVPQSQYSGGALASALYIASGIRGMERGTLSEQRNPDGTEPMAQMELVRLALPRRVFTLSQVKYAIDRITWLYENRKIVGGLEWIEEPEILRFFYGTLRPIGDWQQRLVAKFKADFGESL